MATSKASLNDGNAMPIIAFGVGTSWRHRDAFEAIRMAITNGITHLDGAQMYENEDTLGAAIKVSGKPRDTLFITTKLNILAEGQTVRDSLVESLRKLQLEYVDLFLIHVPKSYEGRLKSIWKEFEDVQREGLAKSIGVSNFRKVDLEEIMDSATITPTVNQIEYHPYLIQATDPVLQFMRENTIIPASFGGLTPLYEDELQNGPLASVLPSIRERLEKVYGTSISEGQILHVWLRQKGFAIITTTSRVERLREYLEVPSIPDLPIEDVQAIDEAGRQLHFRRMAAILPWIDGEGKA